MENQRFNIFRYPVLVWSIVWIIYLLLYVQFSVTWSFIKASLLTGIQIGVFYLSQRWLIPTYFKNKLSSFIFISTTLVIGFSIIASLLEYNLSEVITGLKKTQPPFPVLFFMNFILLFIPLWIGVSLHIFKKERRTQNKLEYLQREKAETELRFLKAQINPHFLFNALNNIYTITYIGDKTAPDKIAMLSDMLRYVIYDCNSDFVPLEKELVYLGNFIEFQKLKTDKDQKINVSIDVSNVKCRIAPMILVPFVENAFKHSKINKDVNGFIEIRLRQEGGWLKFSVKNSLPSVPVKSEKGLGGIGIENLVNRLELIYGENARLKKRLRKQEYYISLEIELNHVEE